ncbi:MAG: LytTR family transcriptional regulator DNA-binding domain-containing protein [Lachnospiraceae bacterium]|nr:LytTR family transcriptional regulator DNA-binding domain-containing protein [Lachnospiraceae bacterium]
MVDICVAICNENNEEVAQLRALLNQYGSKMEKNILCSSFKTSEDFLEALTGGNHFDLLLLTGASFGAGLEGSSGMAREATRGVPTIFISSADDYPAGKFMAGSYYYQLKPIIPISFVTLVEHALGDDESTVEDSIIAKNKTGLVRVPVSKVEYCEEGRKNLTIHLTDESRSEVIGELEDLYSELGMYPEFAKVDDEYLINMKYILSIKENGLIEFMTADGVKVSKAGIRDLADKYENYKSNR